MTPLGERHSGKLEESSGGVVEIAELCSPFSRSVFHGDDIFAVANSSTSLSKRSRAASMELERNVIRRIHLIISLIPRLPL